MCPECSERRLANTSRRPCAERAASFILLGTTLGQPRNAYDFCRQYHQHQLQQWFDLLVHRHLAHPDHQQGQRCPNSRVCSIRGLQPPFDAESHADDRLPQPAYNIGSKPRSTTSTSRRSWTAPPTPRPITSSSASSLRSAPLDPPRHHRPPQRRAASGARVYGVRVIRWKGCRRSKRAGRRRAKFLTGKGFMVRPEVRSSKGLYLLLSRVSIMNNLARCVDA